jgi:hypothetical protein
MEKVKILFIYQIRNQNISLDFSKIKKIIHWCLIFVIFDKIFQHYFSELFSAKIHHIIKVKVIWFITFHAFMKWNEIRIS